MDIQQIEQGPMADLINDCVLHILRYLSPVDILLFGCTNLRFFELVLCYVIPQWFDRRVSLVFNHDTTHRIIQLFGKCFRYIVLAFYQSIPADLFSDGIKNFIGPIEVLDLIVTIPDHYFVPVHNGDVIGQMTFGCLESYRRSTNSILNLINTRVLGLNRVRFAFVMQFNSNNYRQFIRRHRLYFAQWIDQVDVELFTNLNGNLMSHRSRNDREFRVAFMLEFSL